LVYPASEAWVGALLEKLSWLSSKPSQVKFHITRRCSTVPLRSTGQVLSRTFVNLLRKFLSQKYNLKPAAELNVTKGKKFKATASETSQKAKAVFFEE